MCSSDLVSVLEKTLAAHGFRVRSAPSPWQLTDADSAMLTLLGDGVATAVAETGLMVAGDIAAWKAFHMPEGRWRGVDWTVGHADMLAVPPGSL